MSEFTLRQLVLLKHALRIANEDGSLSGFGSQDQIEHLELIVDRLFKGKIERRRKKPVARKLATPDPRRST